MHARFTLSLASLIVGSVSALAAQVDNGWVVNFETARVLHADPIVIGGGMFGDRIVFDVHRPLDNSTGTLSLSCVSGEYALTILGPHTVKTTEHASQWPLTAQLVDAYCARINILPEADPTTPLNKSY